MSLNIGTLVGYLKLDDSNFERKADAADRKINALKLHLDALGKENPKISVEVATQTAALDELQVKIADLKARAAEGVDIRVEAVQALIEMDRVQAKVRELHGKTITIDADTAPAERKLRSLNGLWTAILGLGPTLVPITGAATLGIGAIGAAALSAAGAVGVLKAAFAGMGSAISAYGSYQAAIDKATGLRRVAIQAASTPAARQAANQAFATAQTAANATLSASQYGQLGPQGQRFARFAGKELAPGGDAFRLRSAAQESVLPGVMQGIRSAHPALPAILSTERSIGGAVGGEVAAAGKALNNPFWQRFFTWLGREAPKDVKLFGSIFGSTIEGILRSLKRFSPEGDKLLQWVDSAAKKFNQWSGSRGFSDFVAGLKSDGVALGNVLGPLVTMLPALLSGLNSTGVGELNTVGLILKGISMLPPQVISLLAATLPAILLALKGFSIAQSVAKGIQAMGVAMGILDGEMEANPIGLVVVALAALAAGLYYAYKHSTTFRNIVNAAFRDVAGAAQWMWEHAIHPAIDGSVRALQLLGKWATWLWNNAFQPALRFIVSGLGFLLNLWGHMLSALGHVPGFGWAKSAGAALQAAADQAQHLADNINKIPNNKKTVISIDVVRTVHGVVHGTGGHVPNDPTVPRHAAGGWSFGPGSGTSDNIPSLLSNGEFTVNALSARANAPLLEAVNRSHGPLRIGDTGALSGRSAAMPARYALTITNWDEGTGHIEAIASDSHAADHRYATAVGRN